MKPIGLPVTLAVLGLVAAAAFAPVTASAQDEDEEELVYDSVAVQNRLYSPTHELSAFFGVLPIDAFEKGLTLGGGYTYHFSEIVGWEIAHGFYSFHVPTRLRGQLEAFDLEPTPFEVCNALIATNIVLKPIYWKGAWMNRTLIHGEIMFVAGGGYAWFTRTQRPAVDGGLALRLFIGRLFSLRFDVRYYAFFNRDLFRDPDVRHELWTALGTSLTW